VKLNTLLLLAVVVVEVKSLVEVVPVVLELVLDYLYRQVLIQLRLVLVVLVD
jgi:hypothetical protein